MLKLFKIDKVFIHLFRINTLYANPSYTSRMYKKDKFRSNPSAIYNSIYNNMYIFSSVAMLFLYTVLFLPIDFKNMPAMLDATLGFLVILNITQTFTYCFNIFYESRDSEAYMPYPISEKMVFLSKMAVISISTVQLAIPTLPLIAIFHIKNGTNIVLAVLFGLISFTIFSGLIVAIDMLLVKLMAKTALLSKFKTGVITAISTVSMIINVVFILILQNYTRSKSIQGTLRTEEGFVSDLIISTGGQLIFLLSALIVALLIMYIALKGVGVGFYNSIRGIQGDNRGKIQIKGNSTKKSKNISSKRRFNLFKYNRSILSEPTIIVQTVVTPALMPALAIMPLLIDSTEEVTSIISENMLVSSLFIAVMMGLFVSVFPNNLSSIIISLDRENFNYIKALPVNMYKYMSAKLLFSTMFSMIVPVLYLTAFGIYFKSNLIIVILSIVMLSVIVVSSSVHWMIFDYKHLLTNWQSVSDLQNRMPRVLAITLTFLMMIVIFIFIGMISVIAAFNIAFSLIILLGLGVIWFVFSMYMYKKFVEKIK